MTRAQKALVNTVIDRCKQMAQRQRNGEHIMSLELWFETWVIPQLVGVMEKEVGEITDAELIDQFNLHYRA